MKQRLLLVVFGFSLSLSAQYSYDYSQSPVASDVSHWQTNGAMTFQSFGVSFGSSAGSMIYTPAISGSSANDYEVNTTVSLKSAGGIYALYFRANSATVNGCTATAAYISIEFNLQYFSVASGSQYVPYTIKRCSAGSLTTYLSSNYLVRDGISVRAVVHDSGASTYLCLTGDILEFGQCAVLPAGMSGKPGIGGSGIPLGSGFSGAKIGHYDAVAPNPVAQQSVKTSIYATEASLRWQGAADNQNGIGIAGYHITRTGGPDDCYWGWIEYDWDGSIIDEGDWTCVPESVGTFTPQPELTDNTVQAGWTYTYTVDARDYHGNGSSATSFQVTTPPYGAIDPRRIGVRPTGAYWGGGGEQIDMLSGNLNFTQPLVSAQLRGGGKASVSLSYNSQNWRNDNGENWQLGADVGYGFGWKVQFGSLTPYYSLSWYMGIDHYILTDATGAEYRVQPGVYYGSTDGIYALFDSATNELHFPDGTFWVMGSLSSGAEQDAGTMYPTIIEDVSGNQILISYDSGAGLAQPNTSARITAIEDVRATGCPSTPAPNVVNCTTYAFSYSYDSSGAHLTSITNTIGTSESYVFHYGASQTLAPPFGYDPLFSGIITSHLSSIDLPTGTSFSFSYDTAGAGELVQASFPFGGHLRWAYFSDAYSGSRYLRGVSTRYLAADSAGATEWSYPLIWDDASGSATHVSTKLVDASGVGAKVWKFFPAFSSGPTGYLAEFLQLASASSSASALHDLYTWSSGGSWYISSHTSIRDEGTANQKSALTTQTIDSWGNVTQSAIYPFNNTTVPIRTYTNTYLSAPLYATNYIFNRLLKTVLNSSITLVQNYYDGHSVSGQPAYPCPGSWSGVTPSGYLASNATDLSPPIPFANRGFLSASVNPATKTCNAYFIYGAISSTNRSDGLTVDSTPSSLNNYAAPQSITTQSSNQSLSYNAFLGVTQTTGLHGEQMTMTYDTLGRPSTATSPYGTPGTPTVTYSYSASGIIPAWQQKTGPDGVTITALDGLGRTIRVQRGSDATHIQSIIDTVYSPCACSPMGKVQKVSQPYAPGSSTVNWTVYTYDGLGRPVAIQQPDGASTVTYSYSGDKTTVTDPAGKWKQSTSDVLGNVIVAVEPDPGNQPSGTLTTVYAYDWMNNVSQVTTTRGSTTQVRSFGYYNTGKLAWASNPENGTTNLYYNADLTLSYQFDARGQETVYTYDSQKRVVMVQRFVSGAEDICQRVAYSYDTNPYNSGFSQNGASRLTAVAYGPVNASGQSCIPGVAPTTYVEMYSYHPAGAVISKRLQATRNGITSNLDVSYTYDSAGRNTTTTYPMAAPFGSASYPAGATTFTSAFDSMGRVNGLVDSNGWTWVQGVQYDYAGRLTNLQYLVGSAVYTTESMGYNGNSQLTSLNWTTTSGYGPTGGIQYFYSATQNNGQITQAIDTLSNETITYGYDPLKRVVSAASNPISGTSPAAWTQSFQYDGFGNLTSKILNGITNTIGVDPATNRLSGTSYDANGNMTSGAGATFTYDVANQLSSAAAISGGTEYYSYSPDGQRVYRLKANGSTEEWTFYGAMGERLGVYSLGTSGGFQPLRTNVAFGGSTILDSCNAVFLDRLGTNRASGARFYPYGEEITSTTGDRLKFAGYLRDAYTGLDLADEQYYASVYGRFNSPLPGASRQSAYTYGGDDPVNDPYGDNLGNVSYPPNGPADQSGGVASAYPEVSSPTCAGTVLFGFSGVGDGTTIGQLMAGNSDLSTFSKTIFAESTIGYSVEDSIEKAAIAAVIMNRWQFVNGNFDLYNGSVYDAGSGKVRVVPDWGNRDSSVASIVYAPGPQFQVWASPGVLSPSSVSRLNGAENKDQLSIDCFSLVQSIGTADEFWAARNQHTLYTDSQFGLTYTSFGSGKNNANKSTYESTIGSYGSNNVFYGVDRLQIWLPGLPLPVIPVTPRPPRRPVLPPRPRSPVRR